jgi:hypothetical protein
VVDKHKIGRSQSRQAWAKKQDPISKITKQKGLEVWHNGGIAPTLSSNPSTTQKIKKSNGVSGFLLQQMSEIIKIQVTTC